ncbi:MAG: TetR/AcrR family transcriptional regulator [Eubacteriales bacterium]|nr:TetR/AcrR family transcriptional regulator [Eubacteriales bacterium]
MKREEKNLISREKIITAAQKEFAEKGYGLSSVNTICAEGAISKGILYHYFKDKDEVYLQCVRECFDHLTTYLRDHAQELRGSITEQLDAYFSIRNRYFSEHREQQRIFCEAVISPPKHLATEIAKSKEPLDQFNIETLQKILSLAKLRSGVSIAEVVDTFRSYQDFINARFQMLDSSFLDTEKRDAFCHKAILILLYGVITPERE